MKHLIKLGICASVISLLSGCAASDIKTMTTGGEAIPVSNIKHHPIAASKVKLYYSNISIPKHFQVVGHVSANNDNMIGIPHSQETIAQELKKQAASLGANGVMNMTSNLEQTTGDAILSK